MRTNGASLFTLAALLTPALCVGQAQIIGIPQCAADGHGDAEHIGESKASSCQDALLTMYTRGNEILTAPSAGCNRIITVDPCDVFLCAGDNGSQGKISVGALATAAQDIHSYCRLNDKVGGRVGVKPSGGKPDGSVIVQVGVIPKDELKVREVDDAPAGELRSRAAPPSMRRFRRSDEDLGLAVGQGINEGEEVDMDVVEMQALSSGMYDDVVRVQNEPNPNWRNTAVIEREFEDENGPFTVVMGYLSRNGETVMDLGNDNNRIDELIQETVGMWWGNGMRSLFSAHLYRRFRNARDQIYNMALGEFVINIERGNRGGMILPALGGSQ